MSKVELDVLLTDHGAVQTGMDVRQAAARKNDRQTGRMDTTSQILCEYTTGSCGIATAGSLALWTTNGKRGL